MFLFSMNNIRSFFICSCTFIHSHSFACLYLLCLNDIDLTMSPVKVVIRRIIAQEDREIKSYQEETKIVNLGAGNEKKEVKVGVGMTTPVHDELVVLLTDYQDVFAWSYQGLPRLNPDIVQHRLPLNPGCSPVKQKLRRMEPKMSLKIKKRGEKAV